LPSAEEKETPDETKAAAVAPSFAQALTQVLKGK
jgi:hypothetical protein